MYAKKNIPFLLTLLGALVILLAACGGEPAQTAAPSAAPVVTQPQQLSGNPARGGQLYDKWWGVLGVDAPAGDQPLWATQTTNTRSGSDTWRCKECHGWDYKGKDGAYGSGSHATGFPGVMDMAGKDPNEILEILKGSTNPDHDFSAVMDDQALIDLALFMNQGLADDATFVNADKTPVGADATTGATIFTLCSACHGTQGTAINFGNESEPEYLGTIAADNPWEFLHKVRFGQPGVIIMPSGFSMNRTPQEYPDLLAYVQTLPTESPITEGGRLYDKWWQAMGIDEPAGDHPLWATQTTNTRTGLDTWRCKECHGWDYKGKDGAYGSGSHMTGFTGILDAAALSDEELSAWLTGGKNPDHDFSAYMGEAQIKMLIAFIREGVADTAPYINADKTVNGDSEHGGTFYNTVCARCHGPDGKTLNFGDAAEPEFVGTVAVDNPWEAFHKSSFGQPGEDMPAGINFGWNLQDIADLVAYLQTLPTK